MVVVSAVSGRPDSSDSRILEAVETGEVRLAVSDRWLVELVRVMGKPEVEARIGSPARAFKMGLDIGVMGFLGRPRRLHWPNLQDPNDSWVLDLALESGADYIITRDKGVLRDAPKSGFDVLTPPEFIRRANL